MKFTKKTIYIGLFAILYLIVAFSSFFHACAFFALANNEWMSIILAFAFEVGQAAVLFSLLTSKKDRSRIMPWVLMVMFTLVQVIGNVYNHPELLDEQEKYIISENDFENEFHKVVFGSIYKLHMLGAQRITVQNINDFLSTRPVYETLYNNNKGEE